MHEQRHLRSHTPRRTKIEVLFKQQAATESKIQFIEMKKTL